MFPVFGRIHIVICEDKATKILTEYIDMSGFHLILLKGHMKVLGADAFGHISLSNVFKFSNIIKNASKRNPQCKIALCCGREPGLRIQIACLLGCHLIMEQGLGFEEAYLALAPIHSPALTHSKTGAEMLKNALRALCCGKCLNWLGMDKCPLEASPCTWSTEEYLHYARCC
jgi:hypothetical protein